MKKVKSCAIRGRAYIGIPPKIEIRKDEFSNCLDTMIEKDCLVLEVEDEKERNDHE